MVFKKYCFLLSTMVYYKNDQNMVIFQVTRAA